MESKNIMINMYSDNDIVSMSLLTKTGKHRRFVFLKKILERAVSENETVMDMDLKNVCRIYKSRHNEEDLCMEFLWLSPYGESELRGTDQFISFPISHVYAVLSGFEQKFLAQDVTKTEWKTPTVRFSNDAQKRISEMRPEERKAFTRFMKDAFFSPCSITVEIFDDPWVKGFYFRDGMINGGIVPHTRNVKGRDGVVREAVYFAKHT